MIHDTFDATTSPIQNLTFNTLEDAMRKVVGIEKLTTDVLRTLRLCGADNEFCVAAALLADEHNMPGIDMARIGENINIISDRHTLTGVSLLKMLSEAEADFRRHYSYEEISGMRRERHETIPAEAFREAIANALVHRAWDVKGNIRITMHDDHVEVTSPGGLPDGVSEEDYLRGNLSVPRNPILADVFYRLGIIERFGTGIPRIIHCYTELRTQPSFSFSPNSVTVSLPTKTANRQEIRLTRNEELTLSKMAPGAQYSREEIMAKTGLTKDQQLRALKRLAEADIIITAGAGRSTTYGVR